MDKTASPPNRRWAGLLTLLGIGGVAALAPAAILSAQPINDDFNRAVGPRAGWCDYVLGYTYHHWSGRWAGVGLSSFVLPRLDPTRWYPVLLGGLHAVELIALVVFWRLLLGRGWGKESITSTITNTDYEHEHEGDRLLSPWLLAVGTYALLWAISPAPGETYTWFSGGVEYALSLWLSVLLIAALARGCRRLGEGRRSGWGWVAGAGALAFAVCGMHELAGCVLVLALLTGLAAAWLRRRGRLEGMRNAECGMRNGGGRGSDSITSTITNYDYEHEQEGHTRSKAVLAWGLALGGAVAGALVCILAPGNAERAGAFRNGHSVVITLKSCIKLAALHMLPWALHPALWGATLALWLAPPAGARRPAWPGWPEVPWRWLLPLATLGATGIWLAGPSWAMGGTNGRALDATQTCFVLGWLASAVAWGTHWGWLSGVRGARRRWLRSAALGLMLAGMLLAGNTRHAVRWSLLTGKTRAWSRQMELQREAAARAKAAGELDAVVPAVSAPVPPFYYENGITADPSDWRNQSFAAFYGLKSVRTGDGRSGKSVTGKGAPS